jgi:hypothetical protein
VKSGVKGRERSKMDKRKGCVREEKNTTGIGIRKEMNEPEGSNCVHHIIKYSTKFCPPLALTVVSDPLLK